MPRAKQRRRIVICDCRDCVDVAQGPIDYFWEPAARQLPPPRSLILLLEGFNANPSTSSTCCRVDEWQHCSSPQHSKCIPGNAVCCRINFNNRHGRSNAPASSQSELPSRCRVLPSPIIATTPAHLHPLSCQSQTPTRTSSGPAEARLPVPGAEQGASDPHHRPSLGDSAPCNSSADNVSSLSVAPEMDSVSDAVTGGHVSDDEGPCQLPLPPVEQVVARVAELLHLQHGRNASVPDGALGGGSASVPLSWADPNLDVLVLHVKANDLFRHDQPGLRDTDAVRRAGLAWADSLLRTLASSTTMHESVLLHLLVSFSPGSQSSECLRPGGKGETHSPRATASGILSRVTRPQQSWQYSGMQTVEVDEVRPVAVAAYLKGVTRRDDVDSFCLQDILHRGGQGCILIDRVIHEIAYKVARALKFGS